MLAIKGLGQFERFKAASNFRRLIEDWHVSDCHIQAARGSKDVTGDYEHLSAIGDNLQRVAYDLYEHNRELFDRLVEALQRLVPEYDKVSGSRRIGPYLQLTGNRSSSFNALVRGLRSCYAKHCASEPASFSSS